MTAYYSISDPSHFDTWMKTFENGFGYTRSPKDQKAEAIKHPIRKTLEAVRAIPVLRGSPTILELNLLYACYLASRKRPPELDYFAEARKELAAEKKRRPQALKSVSTLLDYIKDHRTIALKAIAQSDGPQGKVVLQPTKLSAQRLVSLEKLLADLEQVLMDFDADPDHLALISSADFRSGPFEFDFDLNSKLKHKGTSTDDQGMHMIYTGLMFHLTYLFRYFTCESLPKTDAFLNGDILVLDGVRMIKVGTPHGDHVAALTNAIFEMKYSSRDVRDKLDSLVKPTPGSKLIKNSLFVGW